jgi:hypothetical protein
MISDKTTPAKSAIGGFIHGVKHSTEIATNRSFQIVFLDNEVFAKF